MALGIGKMMGTRFWYTGIWTRDFLNTNRTNNTNLFGTRGFLTRVFWHTDLTDLTDFAYGTLNTRFFYTRFFWTRITRITRIFFGTRISLISRILSLRLVVNDNSLGYWLVVVIGLLWLLTCCGYWLVVVIDLLCFKWQIKKDVREPCEALADPWDLWDPCA